VKLVEYRNSFLNLAVPSLMMSEPGPATKTVIGSGDTKLEVTLWDRWEYEASSYKVTLLELVDYLEEIYHLSVRDIFYGSIPLFMYALQQGKSDEQRRQALKKSPILDLTHPGVLSKIDFVDLTVTFVDPKANKVVAED
jgi:ubiquitin-activating enzyme E1-like protein 2